MSGQEDFTPLLEILVSCVGVVDVISLIGYMFHRALGDAKTQMMDVNNNDVRMRDKSPASVKHVEKSRPIVPALVVDGLAPSSNDAIQALLGKVNELETKVQELEIKSRENSVERLVEMERYRRSRSPSPYPQRPDSDLREENDEDEDTPTNASSSSTSSAFDDSIKLPHESKSISRDDEFRKARKKSPAPNESRAEELLELSRLEDEEMENMDGFVPIKYDGPEDVHYRHDISPIKEDELPPHNNNELYPHDNHLLIERSPEPGMSTMVDKPWCDIKKDVADIRKHEKWDQARRSLSIEEHPKAEALEAEKQPTNKVETVNVNENFIKMEKEAVQRSDPQTNSKMLIKQAHVMSEEQPEETVSELVPVVEIVNESKSVTSSLTEINITSPPAVVQEVPANKLEDVQDFKGSTASLEVRKIMEQSAEGKEFAVRSVTPEPEVSTDDHPITITDTDFDNDWEKLNRSGSPGEGLKRSKRCINSLDRSASRSSSRLSRSLKSKSPSVASEEDYKEWFQRFDNQTTADLSVPDELEDFDSDMEEEYLIHVGDENINGAEICKIEGESIDDDTNISVSVTLNLKQPTFNPNCNPCAEFQQERKAKTKAEEFLEMERFRENKNRRLSIVPSTDEQQQTFISMLHPEFPTKVEAPQEKPHTHHEHLHNVGYHEWMKKFVDHQSSHLATSDSDSDSDSDIPLDNIQMLPLFLDEKKRKSKLNKK